MTTHNAILEMNPTDVKPAESRMLSAVAHALELEQLGISHPPGALEAAAIREDHATATAGMRAFVRMGFRLMDVKSRLPHGEYIPWCEKFLKGISRMHLSRAKHIAEGFFKCNSCVTFDELPPEALQIIDGTGGYRALLAEFHDFPALIGSEANAKELCEARWTRHPEERDDWEPRVLSGEVSYLLALQGMMGREATAGKPRESTKVGTHLNRAAGALKLHFLHYHEITDDAKNAFLVNLTEALESAPDEVKKVVLAALKGGEA